MNMSLKEELERQSEASHRRIPEDKWLIMQRAAQDLAQSWITEKCLKVGDTAPDFNLPNGLGKSISLQELLQIGPVVLSFYRGGW
jgi:hypothetical protein